MDGLGAALVNGNVGCIQIRSAVGSRIGFRRPLIPGIVPVSSGKMTPSPSGSASSSRASPHSAGVQS